MMQTAEFFFVSLLIDLMAVFYGLERENYTVGFSGWKPFKMQQYEYKD